MNFLYCLSEHARFEIVKDCEQIDNEYLISFSSEAPSDGDNSGDYESEGDDVEGVELIYR